MAGLENIRGAEDFTIFLSRTIRNVNRKKLFFQDHLETVADENPCDEDDHKKDNHQKYAEYAEESDAGSDIFGAQSDCNEDEDNPENDARYRAIPEDAHVVILSFMKKTEGNTENEIQDSDDQNS
jgi:hypothetical protein